MGGTLEQPVLAEHQEPQRSQYQLTYWMLLLLAYQVSLKATHSNHSLRVLSQAQQITRG